MLAKQLCETTEYQQERSEKNDEPIATNVKVVSGLTKSYIFSFFAVRVTGRVKI